jgi:hypothetical protein
MGDTTGKKDDIVKKQTLIQSFLVRMFMTLGAKPNR